VYPLYLNNHTTMSNTAGQDSQSMNGETTLRDSDDTMLYLPSYFTQRNCYAKFCLEKRGMKVTTNNKEQSNWSRQLQEK
jgi:hypothetical protein